MRPTRYSLGAFTELSSNGWVDPRGHNLFSSLSRSPAREGDGFKRWAQVRTLVVNALRMSGKRTAIGRHLEYLAHHWSRIQGPFDRIVFMSPGQLRTENLGTATPIELRSFGRSLPNLLWEQGALPYAARNAAVLFSEYTCPLLFCGPIVVANHGIY